MKPHGFIYITTNTINGKKYIGQCSLHRHDNTIYLGSGKAIKAAIAKYGDENFSREILCYCFSKQDMNIIEELIIREHNAHISPNYYNIIPGATPTGGFSGKTHSIETKEKIRQYLLINILRLSRLISNKYWISRDSEIVNSFIIMSLHFII